MSDAVAVCFNCGQLKQTIETEAEEPGITAAAARCGICKRHPFQERELFAAGLLTDEVFDLVDLLDIGRRIGRTGGVSLTAAECDAVVAKADKHTQRAMALAAVVRAERLAVRPAAAAPAPAAPPKDWRTPVWFVAAIILMSLAIVGAKHGGFVGWSLCVVSLLGFVIAAGTVVGRK
jgi:hypothetical protein